MTSLSLTIRNEVSGDAAAIERLHERAFGPGRFARTAFRLREGGGQDMTCCFAAHVGTFLAGSVRVTPVVAGGVSAIMLGPLTVDPAFEGKGVGGALMDRAISAARDFDYGLVLLVGDAPYYARFGFRPVPFRQMSLPGPVDPARFLVLELAEGALAAAHGPVRPRRT
jgi:predicted N-acetyltransferase YhbS